MLASKRLASLFSVVLSLLLGFLSHLAVGSDGPVAIFPLQFTALLTITSHLIKEDSEYPPRTRRITLYYDYENLRARADIEKGYEAAKTYIRRYDLDEEYMIRPDPINDCKRSYLGETMPFPEIPENKFISTEVLNGVLCNYYLHIDYDSRVHMYFAAETGAPVRLIHETTENNVDTPLLTYDYSEVSLQVPGAATFELPTGVSYDSCDRHIGGFPYLHAFHHFVKF